MTRRALIALLLVACSKGGAECLANEECTKIEVCNLDTLRCDPDRCLGDMAAPTMHCDYRHTCPQGFLCDSTQDWICVPSDPSNKTDLRPPPADLRGADMSGCR